MTSDHVTRESVMTLPQDAKSHQGLYKPPPSDATSQMVNSSKDDYSKGTDSLLKNHLPVTIPYGMGSQGQMVIAINGSNSAFI